MPTPAVINLFANDKGQVGVVHIGQTAPSNPYLIWVHVDANEQLIAYKEYRNGNWTPIGNVTVIDNLNSFLISAALSANQGRILGQSISDNENEIANIKHDLLNNYQDKDEKNQPNGYAGLNAQGFIDPNQLQIDGFKPVGGWDASSGDPPSPNPSVGDMWLVKTAGTTLLNGIDEWNVGDHIFWSVNGWERRIRTDIDLYNALDQEDPGYALDARQGKALLDKIDNQATLVNNLDVKVTQVLNQLATIEQAVTNNANAINGKQAKLLDIKGIVVNDSYTNALLEDIDINRCLVIVSNQVIQEGYAVKTPQSTQIELPPGYDGQEIRVIHIPN